MNFFEIFLFQFTDVFHCIIILIITNTNAIVGDMDCVTFLGVPKFFVLYQLIRTLLFVAV